MDLQFKVKRYISVCCYALIGSYFILAIYLLSGLTGPGLFYKSGVPAGADFLQIWAAASLASQGEPASVYKAQELKKVETGIVGGEFPELLPWHYPPSFLLMILPVSSLNYLVSVALWLFIPLGVFLIVLFRIFPNRLIIWLALSFMSTAHNLFYGQGAFLVGSLLGGGLLLLDRSPLLSGFLFSLIINYKPHLGILILIAILAGRNWQALGSLSVTTLTLVLGSIWLFGLDTWLAFWKDLHLMRMQLTDAHLWDRMITVFGVVRLLGAGERLALTLQILVGLGSLISVYWVWQRQISIGIRASVLVLGNLLATPHAMEYDLTLILIPIAWVALEGFNLHWGPENKLILIIVWLTPWINQLLVNYVKIRLDPIFIISFLSYLLMKAASGGSRESNDSFQIRKG